MPKLVRNALLLAKAQPTLDTDPAPVAATNAILAGNVQLNAIEAEFAGRDNIVPYFGNKGDVLVSQYSTISFDVELAGSGAAGTAPKWSPLILACAFAETITASTSASYAPITSGTTPMVALHFFMDGLKFVLLNAKGSVSFSLDARSIPKMTYTFTGSFSLPTDTAVPSGAVFSGFPAPLGINKLNSPTMTLHGTAVKTQSFGLNVNNSVVYRNLIGSETISITDRAPSGNIMFETESMATKDWYTAIRQGTQSTLSMIHGTTAGNIIEFSAPKVQLKNPAFSESDGVHMMSLDLNLMPNAGNDELLVIAR